MQQVDRVSKLPLDEFKRNYLAADRPVIITDAIDHWPARKLWSPEYFRDKYGDVVVRAEALVGKEPERNQVAQAQGQKKALTRLPGNLRNFKQADMPLREYVDRVLSGDENERWFIALQPITHIAPQVKQDMGSIAYISETMQKLALQAPLMWMGPGDSITNLHFDKLPNFVVQLYGRKKWTVYPASQQEYVYLPSDLPINQFSPVNPEQPDLEKYPKYAKATPLEFTLNPGEALYLPTHWPHYVRSLDMSISMNFWWLDWTHAAQLPWHWLKWLLSFRWGHMVRHYGG
jgi:ribosomal protein L16 Arg81 hydroxylase